METTAILLAVVFLAVPISVKYLLAFEVRDMLETLKSQEKEVRVLTAQLRALEQERRVVERATAQVQTQRRRAQTQRSLAEERRVKVFRLLDQAVA